MTNLLKTKFILVLSSSIISVTGAFAAPIPTGESIAAQSQLLDSKPSQSSFWFAAPDKWGEVASLPGSSLGAASGLQPSWGVVFGAISGVMNNETGGPRTNGGASVGFGIGNAKETLGGAISLSLPSIGIGGSNSASFMGQGDLNVSVGHTFLSTLTGVSAGVSSIPGWNYGGGSPSQSYNLAVTQILPNDVAPVIVNAGIGNSAYTFARSTKDKNSSIGAFASIGVYVLPQLSLIADWTSGITSAGVSIVPIAKLPIVVSLGAQDLFGYQINQTSAAFVASVAYAYAF